MTFTTSVPLLSTTPTTTLMTPSNGTLGIDVVILDAKNSPVCIGMGLDASATGLIATVILSSAFGLLLWILFAVLRPRFRQVYAVREWFAPQLARPAPLPDTWWAFLVPPIPLSPSIPSENDFDDQNKDRYLSDGELGQRVIWTCFLVVAGWSIVGLAGALPLYLVDIPCLTHSVTTTSSFGSYSVLQDLSLLRLLELLNNDTVQSTVRTRVIIVTVFTLVLGLFPGLYLILREFDRLVNYRERWVNIRCQGIEMGWLSARRAPGLVGWGEKRLKDFIVRSGLSASLEQSAGIRRGNMTGVGSGWHGARRNRSHHVGDEQLLKADNSKLEVDVLSVFSIGDTHLLSNLIDERDQILNDLEVAETRYISSFRLSTPEPSLIELPVPEEDLNNIKPHISRPRALAGSTSRRGKRKQTPARTGPVSYVAPSQYYKLRSVPIVRGERLVGDWDLNAPTFGDTIRQRVVGTRFQEVNRDSTAYGRLPIGSRIAVDGVGGLSPILASPAESHGLTHTQEASSNTEADMEPTPYLDSDPGPSRNWADEIPPAHGRAYETNGLLISGMDDQQDQQIQGDIEPQSPSTYDPQTPRTNETQFVSFSGSEQDPSHSQETSDEPSARPRHRPQEPAIPDNRETFAMRTRNRGGSESSPLPPHLRLQPQQPFVRPISDLDHDDLGAVYSDIRDLRSRLKAINAEIIDAQNDCFNDIADGARMKGWLITGRGIRFFPDIQMIEGRSKVDIRWNELQNEGGIYSKIIFWMTVTMVGVVLGASLIAVAGLALADAPDVANVLPFLRPIAIARFIPSGLTTMLVPTLLATLFMVIALAALQYCAQYDGSIAHSSAQFTMFKATFFVLIMVSAMWFIAVGAVLFAAQAFSDGHQRSQTVANGVIYFSTFLIALVVNLVLVSPALLALQPHRLYKVLHAYWESITPRQRFRALYPRLYDPSFSIGCCILAVAFAATFSMITPLIGPTVALLLFFTLVAQRYLVGYVNGRTDASTGGLIHIWLLRRLATITTFQPVLLGLIFLTRHLWIEGGVLLGVSACVILSTEVYTYQRSMDSRSRTLSDVTRDSLQTFRQTSRLAHQSIEGSENASIANSQGLQPRGSLASVLEMMSLRLAVMPASIRNRGPVPLETEAIDDRTATEKAARAHPDAPPHLPPLPFVDHAEEMANILYAPEVLAPPPIVWLPNDSAGIARAEAYDLQRYHGLRTILDVQTTVDTPARRASPQRTYHRRAMIERY